MSGLSSYIVLVFFAAQFVYFFSYSNLGLILAINGAHALQNINLTGIALIIAFVFLSAFINMFMGSASAKWAIMAPVFIPMFMIFGLSSCINSGGVQNWRFGYKSDYTNDELLCPDCYFCTKYDERYGIGTIISTMIPYTFFLTILWTLLLVVWMLVGIPLGPDGPLYLQK